MTKLLTPANLLPFVKQGESSTLELKVNTPEPANLARLISSLANTAGGTIVVGVREPSQVIGTNSARFDKIVKAATALCSGPLDATHYTLNINGLTVGIIEVKRASIPVAAPDGYYQRVGDSTRLLDARDLVTLLTANPDHNSVIASLVQELQKSRGSFDKANSLKTKFAWAVLGAIATGIGKVVLASLGFSM